MITPEIHNPLLHIVLAAVASLLGIAMLAVTWRLIRGPSLADRVIALDILGYFGIGIISVYCIAIGRAVLLSVAILMALMLFLATSAFAIYLERRARLERRNRP